MAAQYDFWKKPVKKGEKDENVLIPRMVSKGTISTDSLIRYIADTSTFSSADLRGALEATMNALVFYLRHGYIVEVGDLGFFSLKLSSRPVTNPKEIHAQSVSVANVNFRSSAKLKQKVSNISLERAPRGFSASTAGEPEKRMALLLEYLENHPFITRTEYCQLTGLLRNKAQNELNAWVKAGHIDTFGASSRKVYIKKEVKEE